MSEKIKVKYNDTEYEVTVDTRISMNDFFEFVTSMTDYCFDDDGEYLAVKKPIEKAMSTIIHYTDFPIHELDSEEIWEVLFYTDIVNDVLDIIYSDPKAKGVYREILRRVDENIEYRKQKIYHASAFDSLNKPFGDFGGADNAVEGMDPETIGKAMKALAKLDADTIVRTMRDIQK